MAAAARPRPADPPSPPFQPDPDIMGNVEGNEKLLSEDQAVAERWLNGSTDTRA